jgi:hypothetical protein
LTFDSLIDTLIYQFREELIMSFEGFYEYICEKGHYKSVDVYNDSHSGSCDKCGSKWGYSHLVDQTNGYEEDNSSTYPAPKLTYSVEDEWKEDHYGNKYAISISLYAPIDIWRKL